MISIIITSFKEPKTIGKCISCIADSKYSGITRPFEIIQVSPDDLTLKAGRKEANRLKLSKKEYIQIIDPHKGKPFALQIALKKAKGDIIVLTDGDTYFGENSVSDLIKPFKDKKVGGVSGRPVSMDSKDNIFGYWGHLLSDAADHRRKACMVPIGNYYVSKDKFFPMSGYIMAIRNIDIDIPSNVLSDDAYISYYLRNKNFDIGYTPEAKCYVKYPTNTKDYFKQKVRSLGGFKQLKKLGVFKKDKQSRSFGIELKYTFFVLRYGKSFKEFIWSILLFPLRLITWIKIFWERDVIKKDMPNSGWERIESTK
ncbi:MAG: glycosyltransferase family 2 protein [Candidatus Dojkabacteria bacterium]|nr:glycosyltransferase family 2 protein [Candidatus Dojkabacteria bacterium]